MKLTSREKLLVGILVAALLFYLEYTFYLTGQIERIKSALEVKTGLDKRIELLNSASAIEKELDGKINQGMVSVTTVMDKYFVTSEQEDIILLMTDLTANSGVSVLGYTFAPVEEVTLGDTAFKRMKLTVNFSSSYPDLEKMLNRIWNFNKMITVESLAISGTESGVLGGNLDLGFYYITGHEGVGYKDNLYQIMPDENFYKSDPFMQSAGAYDFRVNYLYIGGKEPGETAYIPFDDIKGHWAESIINNFGEKGYLPQSHAKTFGPDTPMTRGEFVIMLDRIYKWPMPDKPVDLKQFTDYASLGSYENSIAKAVYKGYLGGFVVGYSDNTLRPRDPITYEEMEFIVQKLKNQPEFKWDSIAAQLITEKGIESQGRIDKKATMTKAEVVYLMSKVK